MLLSELLQLLYYSFSFFMQFWSSLLYCYILSFSFKICNCNMCWVNKRLLKKSKTERHNLSSCTLVMHKILTKNSNCGVGFVKSKTIIYFTDVHLSIIFTAQDC